MSFNTRQRGDLCNTQAGYYIVLEKLENAYWVLATRAYLTTVQFIACTRATYVYSLLSLHKNKLPPAANGHRNSKLGN